jgi:tRNA(Ile)-lysidine synthase
MRGKKKISDFFNDQKFTQQQKENTWLLCSGSDIVWIAAYRADRRFAISNKTTNVLKVVLRK